MVSLVVLECQRDQYLVPYFEKNMQNGVLNIELQFKVDIVGFADDVTTVVIPKYLDKVELNGAHSSIFFELAFHHRITILKLFSGHLNWAILLILERRFSKLYGGSQWVKSWQNRRPKWC